MNKTIYVKDDDLWARVVAHAQGLDRSVSSVIEDALARYLEPSNDRAKLDAIQAIVESRPCPKCGGQCGYWNLPLVCGR